MNSTFALSGALAGAISAFVFALIHDIFISDIWFSLIFMMVAGAICGLCVGWSYGLLFQAPSLKSWLGYNLVYDAAFVLLGAVSVLVFEPITTMTALMVTNGPPDALIGEAMPMTILFTLLMAGLISWLYGRSWRDFGPILLTCVVLILFLGLNVSVIGLVAIPGGSLYLVAEMFGLILAINVVYVLVFILLKRKNLLRADNVFNRHTLDAKQIDQQTTNY